MSITLTRRGLALLAAGALVAGGTLFSLQRTAEAQNQPANKVSAAGSTVEVFAPGETVPVLQERIKVSSPADLILQLTAECDILTDLTTGGNGATDSAGASGTVEMWITIDGRTVPVATDSANGDVVFCNRAHNKTITDGEDDGTDEERDMTQTRQANAFNWLALNTGFAYDSPANGQNILDIVVWASFTETATNRGVAEARVGNRTLIIEPTKVANSETVTETDTETWPTEEPSPEGGNGNGRP